MATIRYAEPSDVPVIGRFDAFSGARIVEAVERRMLVAEQDDIIVGYIAWQLGGFFDRDYVTKLVVASSYRRQGIASELLLALEQEIQSRVFITVGETNEAARALLSDLGWKQAGHIEHVVSSGETQLFLFKDLCCTSG